MTGWGRRFVGPSQYDDPMIVNVSDDARSFIRTRGTLFLQTRLTRGGSGSITLLGAATTGHDTARPIALFPTRAWTSVTSTKASTFPRR